jgi:hypothetical protein
LAKAGNDFKELIYLAVRRRRSFGGRCGQGWIRTTELRRGQIYSLLPLATWLLALKIWNPEIGNFGIEVCASISQFAISKFQNSESHLSESNQRPTDYKSVALPAELKWRI